MISYAPLWVTLTNRSMKKTDLLKNKLISGATLAKLSKNKTVNIAVLDRICDTLNCGFPDIIEHVSD